MNKRYCVYKHTLLKEYSGKENDMVYIGMTSQQPKRRWANGLGYMPNSYFYNAIQKYGWDNFEHEVLFENLSLDEANKIESELIAFYNSTDREFGYNFQTGGKAGFEYTDDVIQKLSETHSGENNGMYGKHHSKETKRLMSDIKKEFLLDKTNHSMYGKHHTDKTKSIISQKAKMRLQIYNPLKGRAHSDETKNKISIAAKQRLSIPQNNSFYGRHHSEQTKELLSALAKERYKDPTKTSNYGNTKKVICLDTNEVYSSVEEVSKKFGLSMAALYQNCSGKSNRCGGYRFRYLDFVDKEAC